MTYVVVIAAFVGGALTAAAAMDAAKDAPRLPSLTIDPDGISVSGVSSGGFMASQFHIAHSGQIMGAAVIAGGPYYCAGRRYPFNMFRSVAICSNTTAWLPFFSPPRVQPSVEEIDQQAARGAIDDPAHLAGDRIYLFSGTRDEQVPRSVVAALHRSYEAYVESENIVHIDWVPAAHAMVTEDFGNACGDVAPPFINDCDYDAAGELLTHIYGTLAPPVDPVGTLLEFDQSEFFAADEGASLSSLAQVYIPYACANGATCRLHVAFHGCQQYHDNIGDAFYAGAGYNRWAESNDIVVLYPQTQPLQYAFLGAHIPWPNPRGCWDWWGYTGSDHHMKSSAQIRAVAAMIDRLAGR